MLAYNELKDVYKMQHHSPSLFSYMLNNKVYDNTNDEVLFHQLSKEELIERYKELTKKHLEILENL